MSTLPEPIIVACQFGALGIVAGGMWLVNRYGQRVVVDAKLLWHIGIIRWLGVKLAIWRGRRVQDRRHFWPWPREKRFVCRFNQDEWTFGWRWGLSPDRQLWTRFFGISIIWIGG